MIASSGAMPARPDAPAGSVRPGRRWLSTVLLAIVMGATVLGGFMVAAALPVPEVRPLTVGGALTLRPLPGWELVRQEEAVLPAPGGASLRGDFVQLTRGSGALDVLVMPDLGGDAQGLAALYADQVLSPQLERLSFSKALRPVALREGLEGVRFGYIGSQPGSGAAIEGSVTVAVSASGHGVVFDAWGFEGQLEQIAGEVGTMVRTAEVS